MKPGGPEGPEGLASKTPKPRPSPEASRPRNAREPRKHRTGPGGRVNPFPKSPTAHRAFQTAAVEPQSTVNPEARQVPRPLVPLQCGVGLLVTRHSSMDGPWKTLRVSHRPPTAS